MNTDRLYKILLASTFQMRKGPEILIDNKEATPEQVRFVKAGEHPQGVSVVEVFAMPHVEEVEADKDIQRVDCHFVVIGVRLSTAEKHREELIKILNSYPEPDRLAGGPSYIEVGAVLGSQEAALMLFGLGAALNLWKVITPETFKITGPEADELAGSGMVMISGYKAA